MATGVLYIVGTPIGNRKDITLRALETLKQVDRIACEDTRVTQKLLALFAIKKPLISFHQHSKKLRFDQIILALESGENIALVTDAGTPGISDPGNLLVAEAIQRGIVVIPIPGVSALTALASVAGIDLTHFAFWGFPPHKKGREKFFKEILALDFPVVYFESPHRVIKNLELLEKFSAEKNIILGREITKMFEEIVRGKVGEVLKYFRENKDKVKGEFAIIVY
jgi:16S rRNA (cytidine1402-2'-O)-methyltransferase